MPNSYSSRRFAISPIIDEVILADDGVTFISGGYQLNGTRQQYLAFAEGLSAHALNLDYFRLIGAKITDNRTPPAQIPPPQIDISDATQPEIEAAIAAEVYRPVVYPFHEE